MEKSIVHFDIESTGLSITQDRIIQLSMIKTDLELNILDKKKLLLSNCGVPIQPDAFKAHGISEEMVKDKHPFSSYAVRILTYFDSADYISGFNIKGFDIPLLYEEFARCNIVWNPKPIIDAGIIFKNKEKRTLSAALKFYCGKEIEGAHDAENDVLATIEVLRGQINRYDFNIPEVGEPEYELSSVLVSNSKYDNDDARLTFDNKIILSEKGEAIWNFGKNKGFPVYMDLNYCDWVLSSDFPSQTKNVLRNILNTQ